MTARVHCFVLELLLSIKLLLAKFLIIEENIETDRSAAGASQINKFVVTLLQSDSEGEYSDQEQNIPMKKKRGYQSWVFVAKFDSASLAHKVLEQENIWSINYSNESEDGKKTYYRCNKVKKRGPQCSARRYIWYYSLPFCCIFVPY